MSASQYKTHFNITKSNGLYKFKHFKVSGFLKYLVSFKVQSLSKTSKASIKLQTQSNSKAFPKFYIFLQFQSDLTMSMCIIKNKLHIPTFKKEARHSYKNHV